MLIGMKKDLRKENGGGREDGVNGDGKCTNCVTTGDTRDTGAKGETGGMGAPGDTGQTEDGGDRVRKGEKEKNDGKQGSGEQNCKRKGKGEGVETCVARRERGRCVSRREGMNLARHHAMMFSELNLLEEENGQNVEYIMDEFLARIMQTPNLVRPLDILRPSSSLRPSNIDRSILGGDRSHSRSLVSTRSKSLRGPAGSGSLLPLQKEKYPIQYSRMDLFSTILVLFIFSVLILL